VVVVCFCSGANDLNNQHGSWPLANQEMHAALDYAGYDNHFDFGVSGSFLPAAHIRASSRHAVRIEAGFRLALQVADSAARA